MDKGLITQLQILKLSNIKPNFSELARLYDLDRRTVKRYYDGYEGKPKHHNKSSRLDEHYDLIKTKLSLRGANVSAVYEYIKDEVDSSIGTFTMDKGLITQLQILKLSNIKPNFSELARLYDLDRRTVKRYYDGYEGKPKHHNKSSRLDEHYDLIKTKLSLRGANVSAVYEYIKDEVDSSIGTYSNFNKYVKSKGLKPKKTEKGHPRYETDMGVQAQVDWKEDVTLHNLYGEPFTFQVFDYKLGYSRYPVFTYKLYKTRQDVFDCLIASFKATGGIPREILFDNMSSVVDRDGNRANISNEMRAFAKDMGFKIKLCKPRHAFTKGKVEALNKFLAWLVPYEGEFETEEELIAILSKINKKVCERICDETGVPPILLFQKEKEYLQSLPSEKVLESYLTHDRQTTVRKDSMG